jgi:hypothetical protein
VWTILVCLSELLAHARTVVITNSPTCESVCLVYLGVKISMSLLSVTIIRTIKSSMRWVGHVARLGQKINACRILVGEDVGGWRVR